MTAHTPGPWHVVNSRIEAAEIGVVNDSGWIGINSVEGGLGSMYMHSEEQNLANAHVAAAAPDMLELLKAMSSAYHEQPICAWFGAIHAALAKAEGRT